MKVGSGRRCFDPHLCEGFLSTTHPLAAIAQAIDPRGTAKDSTQLEVVAVLGKRGLGVHQSRRGGIDRAGVEHGLHRQAVLCPHTERREDVVLHRCGVDACRGGTEATRVPSRTAIDPLPPRRSCGLQRMTTTPAADQTRQEELIARRRSWQPGGSSLSSLPGGAINDRLMRVLLHVAGVPELAEENAVRQQAVDRLLAPSRRSHRSPDAFAAQEVSEGCRSRAGDAPLEDLTNDLRYTWNHDQPTRLRITCVA